MVGNREGGAIVFHGGVTGGVASVLWNKFIGRVQTKNSQNTIVHTLT